MTLLAVPGVLVERERHQSPHLTLGKKANKCISPNFLFNVVVIYRIDVFILKATVGRIEKRVDLA